MTTAQIKRELAKLQRKICCDTIYKNTFAEFPLEGREDTLYIDKSTGGVYVWENGGYIKGEAERKIYSAIINSDVTGFGFSASEVTVYKNTTGSTMIIDTPDNDSYFAIIPSDNTLFLNKPIIISILKILDNSIEPFGAIGSVIFNDRIHVNMLSGTTNYLVTIEILN